MGKDTLIVAVVSGDFVQRGEFSYFDKWQKTEMALNHGVDIVAELPLYYSVQNAEIFSRMSTKILDYFELDFQVFGAEEEEIKVLDRIIELQEEEDYKKNLMELMKKGNSYSTSQKLALSEYGYGNAVKSNNILALEYMRTMKRENLRIKPYIIKREISDYNEIEIEEGRKSIASATFIREEMLKNSGNPENIRKFISEKTYEILERVYISDRTDDGQLEWKNLKNSMFKFLKYKLLMETKKEIIKIYDVNDEIYARIYRGVSKSNAYEVFLKEVKSRNFSIKRIERIVLNILLNVTKKAVDFKLDYIRILGFNQKGQEYLKQLKKNKKVFNEKSYMTEELGTDKKKENDEKIFVNWKNIEKNVHSEKVKIEKNGFLVKELFLNKKERLNPLIINSKV
jgi:UPF0348 protein HMPREF0554_0772